MVEGDEDEEYAKHQARACQPLEPTGWSRRKARTASRSGDGLASTKAWNQPGMLLDGANALPAKVSGKSRVKPVDYTE